VSTENVKIRWEEVKKNRPGILLDREDVSEQGTSAEALNGDAPEHLLGRENGGTEEHNIRMGFAQIMGILEEGCVVERGGNGGVVGAGVRKYSVALLRESFGQELAEVAETNDGDFECGDWRSELGTGLGESERGAGIAAEGLRSVASTRAKAGAGVVGEERKAIRGEREVEREAVQTGM
jgi:hypothetical protein